LEGMVPPRWKKKTRLSEKKTKNVERGKESFLLTRFL